jgi:hypothetical protein
VLEFFIEFIADFVGEMLSAGIGHIVARLAGKSKRKN